MSTEPLYRLADSTVIEPLVNQWSAWPQLFSPVPASLHLANYQLPALSSYLKDPLSHVAASRDPEMIGGPFVDLAPERAADVKRLLDETEAGAGAQLRLARAVTEFHNRLVEEAKGQCLEPFYEQVPDLLRGYVELVYDYYNRPTVRFFESLLYESDFYRPEQQSLRLWPLRRDTTRSFFMSTPRLLESEQIDWPVRFDDARVDELFRLDLSPRPLGFIRELLGLSPSHDALLRPLLSEAPAATPEPWDGREARVRYLGHACVLVEWNGVSFMTDPFVGARPTEGGLERFSYDDLPAKIDFALVTHSHQDHFALETLLRLRHRIGHLVVPKSSGLLYGDMSLKLMARKLGFKNVIELEPLESIEAATGSIHGVPFLGEHGDLAHSKCGYLVRLGSHQMLFGADSDCLDERIYVNVRKALGPIETVFLGTESVGAPLSWGCGPLFPRKQERHIEQTRRYHGSDAKSGLKILELVGAQRIYNYAMGMEPWIEHLLGLGLTENDPQYIESEKLVRRARGRGLLAAERLYGKCDLYLPVEPADAGASAPHTDTSHTNTSQTFEPTTLPVARGEATVVQGEAADVSPLSLEQEQLWSAGTTRADDDAANSHVAARIEGRLDVGLLERSLGELVRRHETLRSSFSETEGRIVRMIAPPQPARLEKADVSTLPEGEREEAALEMSRRERGHAFDLSRPGPLRQTLVRLSDAEHVLLLTAPAVAADELSMHLLVRELANVYEALAHGREPSREEGRVSYSDFARWQREALQGAGREAQLRIYEQLLDGSVPVFGQADDHQHAALTTPSHGQLPFHLDADLGTDVRALGRRLDHTLSTTLLAAFLATLHQHTGSDDLVLGARTDERPAPELAAVVGPVDRTKLLRTDLSGDPSFAGLMSRVREVCARASESQRVAFELWGKRGRKDAPQSRPHDSPFQILFALRGERARPRVLPGLTLTPFACEGARPACELGLSIEDGGLDIRGELAFDTRLFDEAEAAEIVEHFRGVLRVVAVEPETRLSDVALRAAEEAGAVGGAAPAHAHHVEDQFAF